jgi:hypothetical protein
LTNKKIPARARPNGIVVLALPNREFSLNRKT